jgi:hypothetical protein
VLGNKMRNHHLRISTLLAYVNKILLQPRYIYVINDYIQGECQRLKETSKFVINSVMLY